MSGVFRIAQCLPESRWKVRVGRLTAAAAALGGVDPISLICMKDGSQMYLDPRGRTEAGACWNGTYEPEVVALLIRCCERFGTPMFDIGANVGLISIPVAHRLRSPDSVIAFEPIPENMQRLERSIEVNELGNAIRPLLVALGESEGTMRLAREASFGVGTGNAVPVEVAGGQPSHIATVPVRALDSFDDLPGPAVIKMDVEGYEVHVLRGATATIERSRPIIFGEFNNVFMPRLGVSFLDADAVLGPLGYRYFSFRNSGSIEQVPPRPDLGNVLAVPCEKVERLPV